ncbi:ABC transporter permease subunit [Nocardioides sp. LMS-CY]|uniref:Peptide/nickel transport system permease protein n=1 Tax=Nocardioides soli TaxID=1036020 RepID=A0A7W4Z2Z0_9ACTN|nr:MULTISPECIES: ABC transporter permease [Nocardioides]MBB3044372.1 peptide/nickel transport system permease protein [Nocardioides soli]QWF20323.1 ABC transporter permease subunit [Nocardioides sp. LMS-CY]
MYAYVIRRLFVGVIMLIAMSLVTFVLFFASPIDPARYACGKNCSPELREQTRKALGYDKPVVVQWTDFLKGVVQGRDYPDDPELRAAAPELVTHCPAPCFGYSVVNTKTVNEEIKEAFPVSLSISIAALVLWLFFGVLFGVIAAIRRGTVIDRGIVAVALVLYAFPAFFIGLFLLKFIAIKWQLVDVPVYTPIAEGGVGGWLSSLLLPAITLAVLYMAGYVRMTRAFVLESMTEDYVRTARAKGLRSPRVMVKHTMRAALTPLVTLIGLDFAGLMGGAIITETVFNYNGLGKLAYDATLTNDLPTIIGLVLLLGTFVIAANIIVDVLYAVIDPRVRVG